MQYSGRGFFFTSFKLLKKFFEKFSACLVGHLLLFLHFTAYAVTHNIIKYQYPNHTQINFFFVTQNIDSLGRHSTLF